MSTRADIFRHTLPRTKEQALRELRDLRMLGLDFHLDDDPATVVNSGRRVFSDDEVRWLKLLVPAVNRLFMDEVPDGERKIVNAGAWLAAEKAGWVDVAEAACAVVNRLIETVPAYKLATVTRDHRDQYSDKELRTARAAVPGGHEFEFGNVVIDEYVTVVTDYPDIDELRQRFADTDEGHNLMLIDESPVTFTTLDELASKSNAALDALENEHTE